MNKLTEQEIQSYLKPRNKEAGIHAITREMLQDIDLDKVSELTRDGDRLLLNGVIAYKLDRFAPRAGSYAFKPSFAGSQVLLGRVGRTLYFSNGVWFVGGW